jgi:hypothetical protein
MGYKVDMALKAKFKDLQTYENAVAELEDAVVILGELEDRLDSIVSSCGRSDRADYIRDIIKDPERMSEAMDEVDRLEKKS